MRLYYCVREANGGLFFGGLEPRAAAAGGATLVRFDSGAGHRTSADAIKDNLGGAVQNWSYYFCG